MTAFFAGYVIGSVSLAFALGAVIRLADQATPKPPTTVRDPETGALWTETNRVDTWA